MWKQYASECIKPAVEYFKLKFETEVQQVLSAFKSVRLFNPMKVNDMHPSAADVDILKSFEFLDQTVDQLKGELPAYLVAADGVSQEADLLEWWGYHSTALPYWSNACKKVILYRPLQQLLSEYFPFSKIPLVHNRSLPYKITLKQP